MGEIPWSCVSVCDNLDFGVFHWREMSFFKEVSTLFVMHY